MIWFAGTLAALTVASALLALYGNRQRAPYAAARPEAELLWIIPLGFGFLTFLALAAWLAWRLL